MDADERRLTIDFYLCEFVFICGCFRKTSLQTRPETILVRTGLESRPTVGLIIGGC
jgi:hypothetical protein